MKRATLVLILLIVMLPTLLFLNVTKQYENVRVHTTSFFLPAIHFARFVSYNLFEGISYLKEIPFLIRDNESLRSDLMEMRQYLVDVEEMQQENERLKLLLNFIDEDARAEMSAQIIGRSVSQWSNEIILSVGEKDGLSNEVPIVSDGGLVGKTVSTSRDISRALLITDRNCNVSALVEESRDLGILEGDGDRGVHLRYIPLNARIAVGDTLITSGQGGIYPKGIAIGKIKSVEKDKHGLYLEAGVDPFVDFSRIEEVVCLKKSS